MRRSRRSATWAPRSWPSACGRAAARSQPPPETSALRRWAPGTCTRAPWTGRSPGSCAPCSPRSSPCSAPSSAGPARLMAHTFPTSVTCPDKHNLACPLFPVLASSGVSPSGEWSLHTATALCMWSLNSPGKGQLGEWNNRGCGGWGCGAAGPHVGGRLG